MQLEDLIQEEVLKLTWPEGPARDAGTNALREGLVRTAMDICHETGDVDSFVKFVSETISRFLSGS